MITKKNESKIITNDISWEFKGRFDGKKNAIQSKGAITINVFVSVKNVIYVKKIVFGILLLVVPKMKNI